MSLEQPSVTTSTNRSITEYRLLSSGLLHRLDGPCHIDTERDLVTYRVNGRRHRIDGPAIIEKGKERYFLNNTEFTKEDWEKERLNHPVITFDAVRQTMTYRLPNGKLHRDDGPAYEDTKQEHWYKNGLRHRENGPAIITKDGKEPTYYRDGQLHRDDGPAYVDVAKTQHWYKKGVRHCATGPAVIYSTGAVEYYLDGVYYHNKTSWENKIKAMSANEITSTRIGNRVEYRNKAGSLHREDGPALVYDSGDEYYYINNKLHRLDGPAVISSSGTQYYNNGLRHRVGAPAVITNYGTCEYYQHGKLHRLDGPATHAKNGTYGRYYVNGRHMSKKKFQLDYLGIKPKPTKAELQAIELKKILDRKLDEAKKIALEKAMQGKVQAAPSAFLEAKTVTAWKPPPAPPLAYSLPTMPIPSVSLPIPGKLSEPKKTVQEKMKKNLEEGMYMALGQKAVTQIKGAIIGRFDSADPRASMVRSILEMPGANEAIGMLFGLGLDYIPKYGEDPRLQKIAETLRTSAIAGGAGLVLDTIVPAAEKIVANIPDMAPRVKTRVVKKAKRIEIPDLLEEEEEELAASHMTL
jgi:hypothetical protein